MKEIKKQTKGITLIALVITIIVLLILAGVSIAMLTGENGILTQAQRASEQTEASSEEEKVKLAATAALTKNNGQSIKQTDLEEELENYFNTTDFSVATGTNTSGENGFIVTVTEKVKEERKYFVGEKGIIGIYQEPQVSKLTDVYVTLYTDGTLAFSSNNEQIADKTVEEIYGNIKDEILGYNDNPWQNKSAEINKVVITNKIVPKDTSYWFCGLTNIEEIEGIENLDTSNVTNMAYMFASCSSLTILDLSSLNTNKVTDMNCMFLNCRGLTDLNLSNFNTSNVTDMNTMFYECSKLQSLDLSDFNTSNVTNMMMMFQYCSSLTSLNLSSFDTTEVTNMSQMFFACESLPSLDLSSFNTSKATNMDSMFFHCSSLTEILVGSNWKTDQADTTYMFDGCGTSEVTQK